MYVEHRADGEPGEEPVEWWQVWDYGVVAVLAARHVKLHEKGK